MNLQEYWDNRAPYYEGLCAHDVLGRKILKHKIDQLKPKSVIEIGCGRGEVLTLLKDVPRIVGIDFSPNMLEYSRRRVERHNLPIELKLQDITKGFVDEKFDLAVTRTVLMHIHPDDIYAAAKNISQMSDQLLFFEYWEESYKHLAPHNWLHDYVKIFTGLGYHLEESYSRMDMPQTLFLFKR